MGRMKGILVAVLVIGGITDFKFYQKGGNADEARAAVHSWIESAENYDANKDYDETLLTAVHEKAFDDNYRMGGKRRKNAFNAHEYVHEVLAGMKAKALADGRPEIGAALTNVELHDDSGGK